MFITKSNCKTHKNYIDIFQDLCLTCLACGLGGPGLGVRHLLGVPGLGVPHLAWPLNWSPAQLQCFTGRY